MKTAHCLGIVLLGLVAALPRQAAADDASDWAKAQEKFVQFITPVIEEARARLGDPHVDWAEVSFDLLKKYMPDVKLYVRDGAFDMKTKIWALTREGEIVDLGDGLWRGASGNQWFAAEKVAAFVKSRRIKVGTVEEAVDVARLVEKMQDSANAVSTLKSNTKNYRLFDEQFLKWMYGSDGNWKYTGRAGKDGTWEVKKEYVGPQPVSIQAPPTYVIVTQEGLFVDLRREPGLKP